MILYYTPGSVSLVVHIALEMSKVPYQAIAIDFSQQEQKSERFLTLNPLARVPALVTERGVITEASAILNYLLAQFCGKSAQQERHELYNVLDDHFLKAQIDSFNSFMSSTVHVGHAHIRRGERWVDNESSKMDMANKAAQNMTDYFCIIEQKLFVGPWVHGETFTSSDLYLFVITRWLKGDGVDYRQFSKVTEHYQKMLRIHEIDHLLNTLYQ